METFTIQIGLKGKIELDESVIMNEEFSKERIKNELLKKFVISESFMDIIHDETGEYVVSDLDIADKVMKVLRGEAE